MDISFIQHLRNGKNTMRHFIAFFWLVFSMFIISFVVFFVMPEENKDVIYIVIGFVISQTKDVIGFYFGTSQGSSDKSETIKKQIEKTEP